MSKKTPPRRFKHRWVETFLLFLSMMKIPSKELVEPGPIVPYEAQLQFLRELDNGLDERQFEFVCLKARQLGITTILLALDIFWLYMHPGLQGALVADTHENRETFRQTITQMLESLPAGFRVPIASHNRGALMLTNGSRLQYMSAGKGKNSGLGRSRALNFLHASEISSWGDQIGIDSLIAGLSETNPNRLYIWESPLSLDTPIPTPTGWSTMGAIKEGDQVFNEEGQSCRVKGTSQVFSDRKCFRITFDNGDSIVADAGHKWRVAERRWPTNPQWRVMDVCTSDLDPAKHVIYVTKPLLLPDVDLPIDPYLLGVWLGDGASRAPRITAAASDIEEMQALLSARGHRFGVTTVSKNRAPMFTVLGVKEQFQAMNLIENKHIPNIYLRASEAQRRELLAGLMDTDGFVDKATFQCNFTSTSMQLLAGVSELIISLGIKPVESCNAPAGRTRLFPQGRTSTCKEARRLRFSESPALQVFKLPRKRQIHETPRRHIWRKSRRLRIVSIVEIPSVPVKCIAVDTPSHLFLAGRTMIPTHNTALGFNVFYDLHKAAKADTKKRAFFIGWWAKESYSIHNDDPDFKVWWLDNPALDLAEQEIDAIVQAEYGYTITPNQWAWYRKKAWDRSELSLKQEFPSYEKEAWQTTGAPFFAVKRVNADMELIRGRLGFSAYRYDLPHQFAKMACEETRDITQATLRIWELPVKNAKYAIGVDVAYGRSDINDRHCISVFRCFSDKIVQVAEYNTSVPETRTVAWVLAHLAGSYRDCMINLEVTGPGQQVMDEMRNLRQQINTSHLRSLEPLFKAKEALDMARWYLYHRPDQPGGGYLYGFRTNAQSKSTMYNSFRDAYNTEQVLIRSVPLLEEMITLVQNGAAIQASARNKDDRVFAAGLANHAWSSWIRATLMAENRTYLLETAKQQAIEDYGGNVISSLIPTFFKQAETNRQEAALRALLGGENRYR